jgi:hypothetical protein
MGERTRYERWYERDEALAERKLVRSGLLTAELDGPDLRYVRIVGVEIMRRPYLGVRDQDWGTVPPVLSSAWRCG